MQIKFCALNMQSITVLGFYAAQRSVPKKKIEIYKNVNKYVNKTVSEQIFICQTSPFRLKNKILHSYLACQF